MELHLHPYKNLTYPYAWSPYFDTRQVISAEAGAFQRRPPLATLDLYNSPFNVDVRKPRQIKRVPILCHNVRDARQTGFRLIADPTGAVAFEEQLGDDEACKRFLTRLSSPDNPFFNESSGVRCDADRFYADRLDRPNLEVSGTTLGLFSAEPSNYGSWLFRVIPKLAIAEMLGIKDYKVACWCPRPFQRDLLQFFGIESDRIVDVEMTWSCNYENLHVPTCLNPEAFLNETTLNFVQSALKRHGIVQARRRLIYISRISHARAKNYNNVRFFIDESRLVDELASKGFEIVEPEKMSVREQIEMFANAACVVGASGAAMFNTIFSPAGTLVYDIEAFPYWLHAHSNYFSSCGHNYVIAFGSQDMTDASGSHRRWTIDIDAVSRQIDVLLQAAL